jgi:hypothetical protein
VPCAVWQDSRNGNPDIYFAKLTAGGSTWTTPNVKVSDDPGTAAQTAPRIGVRLSTINDQAMKPARCVAAKRGTTVR